MPQSTPVPLMSAQLWYGVPIQDRASATTAARWATSINAIGCPNMTFGLTDDVNIHIFVHVPARRAQAADLARFLAARFRCISSIDAAGDGLRAVFGPIGRAASADGKRTEGLRWRVGDRDQTQRLRQYLPRRLHCPFCRRDLCPARFSEEVEKVHSNARSGNWPLQETSRRFDQGKGAIAMSKKPAARDPSRNVWLQLGFADAEEHYLKAELVLRLSHAIRSFELT